jgi:hypothetical protein
MDLVIPAGPRATHWCAWTTMVEYVLLHVSRSIQAYTTQQRDPVFANQRTSVTTNIIYLPII